MILTSIACLFLIKIAWHILKMINSRHKVFEFIFHISCSAIVNDESGKRFSIEEEKWKKVRKIRVESDK